jgi:hypothetical protein
MYEVIVDDEIDGFNSMSGIINSLLADVGL